MFGYSTQGMFALWHAGELVLARSRRWRARLLAQSLGVASPLVGELEEQCAAFGVFDFFSGANAFVRVLLVQLCKRHGSSSIKCEKGPTPVSQVTHWWVAGCCGPVQVLR